jgi:hypothetical protein
MDDLAQHLGRQLAEWPSQQLQALETVVNSPFIADTGRLIYSGRSLFDKRRVRFSRVMCWGFILKLNLNLRGFRVVAEVGATGEVPTDLGL